MNGPLANLTILFVKNKDIYHPSTISQAVKGLKPTPGYCFGYCFLCWNIDSEACSYWDSTSKNGFSNWVRHTKSSHKLFKKLHCLACKKEFANNKDRYDLPFVCQVYVFLTKKGHKCSSSVSIS